MSKMRHQSSAPWKDFCCQRCKGEFTRRAFDVPTHCFDCEWRMSDTYKLNDPRLALAATSLQCAVSPQEKHDAG